ncbi:MAG: hypothetical protein ACI82F_002719 [Planctomycetota bacterium]|jgi:hypothetical protein
MSSTNTGQYLCASCNEEFPFDSVFKFEGKYFCHNCGVGSSKRKGAMVAVALLLASAAAWKFIPMGSDAPSNTMAAPASTPSTAPPSEAVAITAINLDATRTNDGRIYTNSNPFVLSGTVPGATELGFEQNGESEPIAIDDDGAFSVEIDLQTDAPTHVALVAGGAPPVALEICFDSEPPTLEVRHPAPAARYLGEASVPLIQVQTGEADLKSVRIGDKELISSGDGLWTCSSIQLVEGENTLVITAEDLAGNQVAEDLVIIRDMIGPDLVTLSPDPEAELPRTRTIDFQATLHEEVHSASLDRATLTVSGATASGTIAWPETDENTWSPTLVVSDRAGNESRHTLEFALEPLPPQIEIADQGQNFSNTSTYMLRGRVHRKRSTKLTVRSGSGEVETRLGSLGEFEMEIALDSEGFNHVELAVEGLDAPVSFQVNRDTEVPKVSVITPLPSHRIQKALSVDVAVRVEDENIYSVMVGDTPLEMTSTGAWKASVELAIEGQNELIVLATDRAGNESFVEINVMRDTMGPALLSSMPSADSEVQGGTTVTFTCSFSEPVARAYFGEQEMGIDGRLGTVTVSLPKASRKWRTTVEAWDSTGNVASSPLSFKLNLGPVSARTLVEQYLGLLMSRAAAQRAGDDTATRATAVELQSNLSWRFFADQSSSRVNVPVSELDIQRYDVLATNGDVVTVDCRSASDGLVRTLDFRTTIEKDRRVIVPSRMSNGTVDPWWRDHALDPPQSSDDAWQPPSDEILALAGGWSPKDLLSVHTIDLVRGHPHVASIVHPDEEVYEISESRWDSGILTWSYLAPTTGATVTLETTSISATALDVSWRTSDSSGTTTLTRAK